MAKDAYRNIGSFLIKSKISRNFHHSSWEGSGSKIEFLRKDIDTKLIKGKSKYTTILNEPDIIQELEGILANAISPNHVANLQSMVLREQILEILELIDSELASR